MRCVGGGLTQQPASQVKDATVAHPGVTVKGDRAEGGQTIQEPIGEGGQLVVVEMELRGAGRETDWQRGGGEIFAAAVHPTTMTGAEVRARRRPLTSKQEEQKWEQKLLHGYQSLERRGEERPETFLSADIILATTAHCLVQTKRSFRKYSQLLKT